MNSTIDTILAHRSIRRFTEQPLDDGILEQLLRCGQAAATSSFIQAVSVVQVTETTKRSKLVELSGGQPYVGSAAEFLVFCADLERNRQRVVELGEQADFSWTEQFITATVDVALFAQNVVTAAQSLGLGVCYIGGIRNNPADVSELLGLPDHVYPVFGLCLGYPDQNPEQKPRLPLSVVRHQNAYSAAAARGAEVDAYDAEIRQYYARRSNGKLKQSWSEQIVKQAATQSRPFMLDFLRSRGFLKK